MHVSSLLGALTLGAALLLSSPREARADDEKAYALAYVSRPLTLASLCLAPEGGVDVTHSVLNPGGIQRDSAGTIEPRPVPAAVLIARPTRQTREIRERVWRVDRLRLRNACRRTTRRTHIGRPAPPQS